MAIHSTQIARWGLLLTTLALGATLVGTGIANYLGAQTTATAVTRTLATDLLSVRREIRDAGAVRRPVLDNLLAELEPRGARYIAVVAPGGIVEQSGRPSSPVQWAPPGPEARTETGPGMGRPPRPRVPQAPPRADDAPPPGPAQPGDRPPREGEPPRGGEEGPDEGGGRPQPVPPLQRLPGSSLIRAVGWLEPPPDRRRDPNPADRRGPLAPDRSTLVIDFEPLLAESIVRRALALLLTAIAATAVLVVAAVAFWRQSRRAEVAAAQAEHDRHLRALGEMSAVLGHELRNPLTSLKGHAQLLLEKLPDNHPGRRGAATIVGEAVRLEGLANQVLEFVKTGALKIADADPAGVARAAIDSSGVEHVHLASGGQPATWPFDRLRMEQVLVNLLKNARDASPGSDPIDLRVGVSHGQLLFEVSDRGEGLPPGEEDRTFEPFYTKRVHGTGLGLALAKRIVEGHGGTIKADNRSGGGAVFRILLPPAAVGRP
jgi:two-component system sensor histidine kinase HydH